MIPIPRFHIEELPFIVQAREEYERAQGGIVEDNLSAIMGAFEQAVTKNLQTRSDWKAWKRVQYADLEAEVSPYLQGKEKLPEDKFNAILSEVEQLFKREKIPQIPINDASIDYPNEFYELLDDATQWAARTKRDLLQTGLGEHNRVFEVKPTGPMPDVISGYFKSSRETLDAALSLKSGRADGMVSLPYTSLMEVVVSQIMQRLPFRKYFVETYYAELEFCREAKEPPLWVAGSLQYPAGSVSLHGLCDTPEVKFDRTSVIEAIIGAIVAGSYDLHWNNIMMMKNAEGAFEPRFFDNCRSLPLSNLGVRPDHRIYSPFKCDLLLWLDNPVLSLDETERMRSLVDECVKGLADVKLYLEERKDSFRQFPPSWVYPKRMFNELQARCECLQLALADCTVVHNLFDLACTAFPKLRDFAALSFLVHHNSENELRFIDNDLHGFYNAKLAFRWMNNAQFLSLRYHCRTRKWICPESIVNLCADDTLDIKKLCLRLCEIVEAMTSRKAKERYLDRYPDDPSPFLDETDVNYTFEHKLANYYLLQKIPLERKDFPYDMCLDLAVGKIVKDGESHGFVTHQGYFEEELYYYEPTPLLFVDNHEMPNRIWLYFMEQARKPKRISLDYLSKPWRITVPETEGKSYASIADLWQRYIKPLYRAWM